MKRPIITALGIVLLCAAAVAVSALGWPLAPLWGEGGADRRQAASASAAAAMTTIITAAAETASPDTRRDARVSSPAAGANDGRKVRKVTKTDEEWRALLTPEQYRILRRKGTERAFTGAYHNTKQKGVYQCAGCGLDLFSSATKFDSGTGWPSFYAPIAAAHVTEETDLSHGMRRVEVLCGQCGGHLGHVFDDGPRPTNLRYCINSASLKLVRQ